MSKTLIRKEVQVFNQKDLIRISKIMKVKRIIDLLYFKQECQFIHFFNV
jgi:hypothetical protein